MLRELQFTPGEAAFIAGLSQREVQKAFDEGWFAEAPRRDLGGATRRFLGPAELVHLRLMKDVARYAVLQTEAKRLIHQQLRERIPDLILASDDRFLFALKRSPRDPSGNDKLLSRLEQKLSSAGDSSSKAHLQQWLTAQDSVEHASPIGNETDLRRYFDQLGDRLKDPVKVHSVLVDAAAAWARMTERLAEAIEARQAVVSDPDIRGGEPVVRGTRIPVHMLQDLAGQGATHEELLADYPSLDERILRAALLYARTHPRSGRPKKRPWQAPAAE